MGNKIFSSAETNYSGPPEVMSAISIVIAVIIAGWASLNVGRELDSDGGAFWGPSDEPRSSPLVEMGAVAPNQMKVDVEGAENNAAPELKGKLGYDVESLIVVSTGVSYIVHLHCSGVHVQSCLFLSESVASVPCNPPPKLCGQSGGGQFLPDIDATVIKNGQRQK